MMEQKIDMTKPQPCTKFRDAERMAWIAKLMEETKEKIEHGAYGRYHGLYLMASCARL